MRTFGAFWKTDGTQVYGEVIGDDVHLLRSPFWLGMEPLAKKSAGTILKLAFQSRPLN